MAGVGIITELRKPIVTAELLEFIMVKIDSWLYLLKDGEWEQEESKSIFNKEPRFQISLKTKPNQNKIQRNKNSTALNRFHSCRLV